jgi:hypothetical protein
VSRRKVRVYPSLVNIEELLGQWESDRPEAIRRLQIIRDLVGFDEILKPPSGLLTDAIRAYASGTALGAPMLPPSQRAQITADLDCIARGDLGFDDLVRKTVADVSNMKNEFKPGMERARVQTLADLNWESRSSEERRAVTFEAFWQAGAIHWAEGFAERVGLADACRHRGMDGLLHVRPVRLAVGSALSLVFAQTVGDDGQARHPHRGDGYDLWHAIMASAADVFVTGDGTLAQQLERVPLQDFKVRSSIRALLDDLAGSR